MTVARVPECRIRRINDRAVNGTGAFVLYWMIANRRAGWNFSLDRAVEHAERLGIGLIVFEPLRCGYRWASERLHRFIIDGMQDNQRRFAETAALYYPYVERQPGEGKGLLERLAENAAVVVTDDFPCFFIPKMLDAAARLPVLIEAVDSNGLWPMRATDRVFTFAHSFRRFLQKELPPHLTTRPSADPFSKATLPGRSRMPGGIVDRWPAADLDNLCRNAESLEDIPLDRSVPVAPITGGSAAAERRLRKFLQQRLARYGEDRNDPDASATSGLSPYLHFGHLSVHEIFAETMRTQGWKPGDVADAADGKRHGWFGVEPSVESFLDELIVWRELGFNMASLRKNYDEYDSLPDWAQATLADHADDPRPHCYSLAQFERSETHDPLWNAAQRQLRHEGTIHNYLRMLWGKKILEWSESPRQALEIMIELNNKYALDGRDPNSYSGIFWVLGRYDRGWPERPIFGKIRSMSSQRTAQKVRLDDYMTRFGAD